MILKTCTFLCLVYEKLIHLGGQIVLFSKWYLNPLPFYSVFQVKASLPLNSRRWF